MTSSSGWGSRSQKSTALSGNVILHAPHAVLDELEKTAYIEGMSFNELLGRAMAEWSERLSFTPVPSDFR